MLYPDPSVKIEPVGCIGLCVGGAKYRNSALFPVSAYIYGIFHKAGMASLARKISGRVIIWACQTFMQMRRKIIKIYFSNIRQLASSPFKCSAYLHVCIFR